MSALYDADRAALQLAVDLLRVCRPDEAARVEAVARKLDGYSTCTSCAMLGCALDFPAESTVCHHCRELEARDADARRDADAEGHETTWLYGYGMGSELP